MNAKTTLYLICLAFCTFVVCTGCTSTNKIVDADILSHQREIDRLESAIREYDTVIGRAVDRAEQLKDRASGMEGTIDEIIRLFDEYQQAVEQLIRDFTQIRNSVNKDKIQTADTVDNTAYNNTD